VAEAPCCVLEPPACDGSAAPARQDKSFLLRAAGTLAGVVSCGFFLVAWTAALAMPFVFVGACVMQQWELVGGMVGLYALPHLLPLPRLGLGRGFVFWGFRSWLGEANYEFLDLSRPAGAEPEAEPAPGAERKRLLCFHPHGIVSMGVFTLLNAKPEVRILSSPFLYHYAPIFRLAFETVMGFKMGSVAPGDLHIYMNKGDSPLMMVPGGFHEATITCAGKERVFLKNRRGFVKYALRYGYDLVPIYALGENDLIDNKQGGWSWRFWLNNLSLPAVAPWGHWLFPLFPRRGVRLVVAMGPPLEMPHIRNPTKEEVEFHHARYIEALQAMYERIPQEGGQRRPLELW